MATIGTGSRSTTIKPSSVSPTMLRRSLGNVPLNTTNARPKTGKGKKLAASFDATSTRNTLDLSNWGSGRIESEYIRNLQQQVYFLELETKYLQEQLKTATILPPKVTEEADKMMRKLKSMQAELDLRSEDIIRKESQVMIALQERDSSIQKLKDQEESFSVEKKELVNEIVRLKMQLNREQLDSSRRDVHISEIKKEADMGLSALEEADSKISVYRRELDDKTKEVDRLRIQLEDNKTDCLKWQTEYQELEDRFFRSDINSKEEVSKELRLEIKHLRYDCRQKEISAEQDRSLRKKIEDDCAALVKENAALSSKVLELQKQLNAELRFKDDKDKRRQANIQELVTAKENEKHLGREVEHLKEELLIERKKHKDAMEKLIQEEHGLNRAKLRGTKLQSEVQELENLNTSQNEENIQLMRDKMILTDHIADLQSQVSEKDEKIQSLTVDLNEYKEQLIRYESQMAMKKNADSIKWEEFEKMADTLKEFSRHMSPLRQSRTLEYDT